MDLGKIPTLVVGLVVAILIVTVVAIPIIDDASKTIVTEMNNPTGVYSMAVSSSDEVIIEPGTNGSLIINGVEQNQTYLSGLEKIWGQNIALRISVDDSNNTLLQPTVTVSGTVTSVKYAQGVITITSSNGSTTSINSSFFLYPDINGDYGGYETNRDTVNEIHINKTSKAWIGAAGLNYMLYDITGGSKSVVGTPTINNTNPTTTLDAQFVESDDGLTYQVVKGATISYTNTETSEVTNNNWLILYCPMSYLEISETDGAIRTIINIIPLILIVSMLIAVVGTVFVKYN